MAQKARFQPNYGGYRELLSSGPMASLVAKHAEAVAAACGDGFVASQRMGRTRQRAIVYADTWSAKHRDHRDNVMVRVLG
ncbi:hypothetical protein QP968_00730 [Corynebacterium sp. MSK041]|uniref:hypothetical protein n=1 Tax=Corynebacterium sp. MSK041 TaxID=3050194 RepID=UPI00254CF962|nr:hypothetical protein [Corynebacterium sp. MSK041]MDK8794238.1 hypothetical protein [Corynebacterium sp. MSK041]